jgi:3-oxoacyl-[acyl-carrier protein] reductase
MQSERVVVITGGASGMGKCMARYFAERKWSVCIADISADGAKECAAKLNEIGLETLSLGADIRKSDEVRNVIEACIGRWGKIDAWINNAGVTDKQHRFILDVPYQVWNKILSVNLTGTFICVKECVSVMKRQGYGNIANVTSLLGQSGYTRAGDTSYGVSKAAVEALVRYASSELEGTEININALYPGVMVNTGFFDYLEERVRAKLEDPSLLNELAYVLCSLAPGELSGRSFSYQNWKDNQELKNIARKYLSGDLE